MPDISKCEDEECPLKLKCYRYTSTPSEHWQAYSNYKYNTITESCDFFWDNKYLDGYEIKELKNGN